jgi:hypothetical protein
VYPPGFPAILSLVLLISPEYPGNIALLKGRVYRRDDRRGPC